MENKELGENTAAQAISEATQDITQPRYEEEIQWISRDQGIVSYRTIYPGREKNGKKEPSSHISGGGAGSYNDFEHALKSFEKEYNEKNAELQKCYEKRAKLGKKPVMTAELEKLRRNLQLLNTMREWDSNEVQVKMGENEVAYLLTRVEARRKSIANAPPAE